MAKHNFRRGSHTRNQTWNGRRRFEHWYRDNQVYFITARCRDRFPAFSAEHAKDIFWDRFGHYATEYGFTPWVTTLIDNHYHTIGYLATGANLGPMMQRVHGSVAKLVNETLHAPLKPFWVDGGHRNYFDGCIRDEKQARRAYRYTLTQSVRHGICQDYRDYPHTHVSVELEPAIRRATALDAFMQGVRYKRYDYRDRGR